MKTEKKDGYNLVRQENGPDLGYSSTSGVKIITVDGCAFKSFDGSDTLLPTKTGDCPPTCKPWKSIAKTALATFAVIAMPMAMFTISHSA